MKGQSVIFFNPIHNMKVKNRIICASVFAAMFIALVACGNTNTDDVNTVNIIAIMHPKNGKAQELRNALLAVVEPTHAEAGCMDYQLHETKDGAIFLYEVWRSQKDLDLHLQKPYLKDLVGKLDTLLDGKNDAHFGKLISATKDTKASTSKNNDTTTVYIASIKQPKQGKADELRNALLALVAPTHAEAGCITYNLYEEEDGSIFLYEVWRSQEDLEQHFQKPYVVDFRSKVNGMAARNEVHFGELLQHQ